MWHNDQQPILGTWYIWRVDTYHLGLFDCLLSFSLSRAVCLYRKECHDWSSSDPLLGTQSCKDCTINNRSESTSPPHGNCCGTCNTTAGQLYLQSGCFFPSVLFFTFSYSMPVLSCSSDVRLSIKSKANFIWFAQDVKIKWSLNALWPHLWAG